MEFTTVKNIFLDPQASQGKELCVAGWVRTVRDSKAFGFIELNDGSSVKSIQIV